MGADKVLTERAGAATAALLGRRALAADAVAEHDAPTDSELEEPQHDEEPLTPVRFVAAAELPEWDAFAPRKPFSQAGLGGMRNDRTPLNTPYTPQLVKLHLKRHDEFDERDEDGPPPGALRRVVAAIRSKVAVVAHPVRRIRFMVDRTVTLVVPQRIQHTRIFARTRRWIVSYLTTVICVPMVWLCSPMLIALVIFTSPVWCAGVAALLIRQMTLDASRHAALSADYSHSSDQSTTEDDHDEPSPHPLTSIYNHIDYNRSH